METPTAAAHRLAAARVRSSEEDDDVSDDHEQSGNCGVKREVSLKLSRGDDIMSYDLLAAGPAGHTDGK